METNPIPGVPSEPVKEVIRQVPGWKVEECQAVERLTGYTNGSYRIRRFGEDFVVRVANAEDPAVLGVNREAERDAVTAASRLGVAPELIAYVLPQGHMVSRYVHGKTRTGDELKTGDFLLLVARLMAKVHSLPPVTHMHSPFRMIESYAERLGSEALKLCPQIPSLMLSCKQVERVTRCSPGRLALCHNEWNPANIIDTGKLLLLDWECAGMNDPLFDLASFSLNAGLNAEGDAVLLRTCFQSEELPVRVVSQFMRMKFLHSLRETLWYLGRITLGDAYFASLTDLDPRFDFRMHFLGLAQERLKSAVALADQAKRADQAG